MSKKFVYVGSGTGVPGLPHEITEKQAKEQGVYEILKDAIAAGNYKPDKKSKEVTDG